MNQFKLRADVGFYFNSQSTHRTAGTSGSPEEPAPDPQKEDLFIYAD